MHDNLQAPALSPGLGVPGAVGFGMLGALLLAVPGGSPTPTTQPNPPGASFPKYFTKAIPWRF